MKIVATYSRLLAIGTMALILMSSRRADADFITYTVELESKFGIALFPKFDPELGSLIEVDYSISGAGGYSYIVAPSYAEYETVMVTYDALIQIGILAQDVPGQDQLMLYYTQKNLHFSTSIDFVSEPLPFIELNAGFTYSGKLPPSQTFLKSPGGPTEVNMMMGIYINNVNTTSALGFYASHSTATAHMTYVFASAVPEPSSVSMSAIALIAVSGYSWRRQRRLRNA